MDRPFKWAIFNTLAASSKRAPYILSPLCGRGWRGKLLLLTVSTTTYCLSPCQLFSLNKSRWMLVMKTCGGGGQPVRGGWIILVAPSQTMLIATYSHFWCTCFLQNVTNPSIILCFFFSKEEAEMVASQSCRDKKRRSWPRATAYLPKSPVMNIISANLRIYGA